MGLRQWLEERAGAEGLDELGDDEGDALLDSLVLAGYANGHLSDDERVAMVELAMRVPMFRRCGTADVEERIARARARLTSLDERAVVAAVERAGARLPRGPGAETALRMFARVCHADGVVDQYERAAFAAFARALGLDAERAEQIRAEVCEEE